MKIVKKPNLPNQTCPQCGCEFSIKPRNLLYCGIACDKSEIRCPICQLKFDVVFKKKENTNNE